jgi:YebC/PmpR family DNA-binding regulatory protein
MGRAFEFRKVRKMKRWDAMAKSFTRIGKDIVIAVKAGGPDPNLNARLRMVIQNAKAVNMPKDRVEAAIKRAVSKEEKDLEEIVYEGYAPYGVPILVECATDNPTRTVANIRMYFTRSGGTLGKTGSLDFMFVRRGVFKLDTGAADPDELELELIDHGLEELIREEDGFTIITAFQDFGTMQKALEDRHIPVKSAELQRFPTSLADITEEQEEEVLKLVEKIEEDDDVQAVYHNLK